MGSLGQGMPNFSSMPGAAVMGQSGYPAAIPMTSPSYLLDNSSIQDQRQKMGSSVTDIFKNFAKAVGQQIPMPKGGGSQLNIPEQGSSPALEAFLRKNFMPSSGVQAPTRPMPGSSPGTLYFAS